MPKPKSAGPITAHHGEAGEQSTARPDGACGSGRCGIIVPKNRYSAIGMRRNGTANAGARSVRSDSNRASVM